MFGLSRRAAAPAPAPAAGEWLLLVATLPVGDAAARMKILRTFETLGAGLLREGAYLLPDSERHAAAFQRLATYIRDAGGSAWLVRAAPADVGERAAYLALFDRTARWRELEKDIAAMRAGFGLADPGGIAKVVQRQREAVEALGAIDFFPTDVKASAVAMLADVEREIEKLRFPQGERGAQRVEPRKKYFRRNWATRRPLTPDRLASAWLIRRFIDPEAGLQWLDKGLEKGGDKADEPHAAAVTFGFPGAEFTNARDRCTYEDLLATFQFDSNAALVRIGGLVRALDAGDLSVAEASGVETMLAGARRRTDTDDALLVEAEKTFDLLYDRYFEQPARKRA